MMALESRLHISNVPFRYNDIDLDNMLSHFGRVVDAEIIYNDRGSKGYGFVTMSTKEEAITALMKLNGRIVHGRRIEVNPATAPLFMKPNIKLNTISKFNRPGAFGGQPTRREEQIARALEESSEQTFSNQPATLQELQLAGCQASGERYGQQTIHHADALSSQSHVAATTAAQHQIFSTAAYRPTMTTPHQAVRSSVENSTVNYGRQLPATGSAMPRTCSGMFSCQTSNLTQRLQLPSSVGRQHPASQGLLQVYQPPERRQPLDRDDDVFLDTQFQGLSLSAAFDQNASRMRFSNEEHFSLQPPRVRSQSEDLTERYGGITTRGFFSSRLSDESLSSWNITPRSSSLEDNFFVGQRSTLMSGRPILGMSNRDGKMRKEASPVRREVDEVEINLKKYTAGLAVDTRSYDSMRIKSLPRRSTIADLDCNRVVHRPLSSADYISNSFADSSDADFNDSCEECVKARMLPKPVRIFDFDYTKIQKRFC